MDETFCNSLQFTIWFVSILFAAIFLNAEKSFSFATICRSNLAQHNIWNNLMEINSFGQHQLSKIMINLGVLGLSSHCPFLQKYFRKPKLLKYLITCYRWILCEIVVNQCCYTYNLIVGFQSSISQYNLFNLHVIQSTEFRPIIRLGLM